MERKNLFGDDPAPLSDPEKHVLNESIIAAYEKKKEEKLLAQIRSRTALGLAAFYKALNPTWELPPHLYAMMMALADTRIKQLMINLGPGAAKAVALGTKVYTPEGWKKVESLQVGDFVITPKNTVATIIRMPHWDADILYKVTFKDGRTAVVNKEHLWKCYNKRWIEPRKRINPEKWRIKSTQYLYERMQKNKALRWYIPLTSAVAQGKDLELPIEPYTLGCLLGDGHIYKNGTVSITSQDKDLFERIEKDGYKLGKKLGKPNNKAWAHIIKGLSNPIKDLGLLGTHSDTKFIPEEYFNASVDQKFALLQGLMDTDGTIDSHSHASFTSTSFELAMGVRKVVHSLGGIAKLSIQETYYKDATGTKRKGLTSYRISIRCSFIQSLFWIERKASIARNTQYSNDLKLEIVSIEPINKAESICLTLDDPEGLFLIDDYVVTHNSQLTSVIYPAWLLGHDPSERILCISGGSDLAEGFVHATMQYISQPAYRIFFPDRFPDKEEGWSAGRGLFVTGRPPGLPDASYYAAGLTSRTLPGKHGSTLIMDDLHNKDNSATKQQRDTVISRYYSDLLGRQDPTGSRLIVVGRRWDIDDLYGHLKEENEEDWVVLSLPYIREKNPKYLYWDVQIPDNLDCVFSELGEAADIDIAEIFATEG